MQKLIVMSMVLALAGAYAHADNHDGGGVAASMDDSAAAVDEAAMDPSMADATMDVAMMEDVPEMPAEEMPAAPSIVICPKPAGCDAVMKIKRVDDDSSTDPESDNVMSVVEYEVKFNASGVTDGGLLFGAAISIDEEGAGAATANGVNAASAYIGAADGTWTLSFGGVDPGIDLVGNIGLANADDISAKTLVIAPVMVGDLRVKLPAMSGAQQLMMPKATLDATVKSTIKPIKTFTGEIEGYFAAIAGTTLTADATNAEATATAGWQPISAPKGTITAMRKLPITVVTRSTDASTANGINVRGGTKTASGVTGGTQIANVNNFATGVAGTTTYSNTLQLTFTDTAAAVTAATEATSRTVIGLSGKVGSFTYRITTSQPGDDAWSAGVSYKAGTITVGLGMDSNDVMGLGLTGKMGGSTISGTYVKQSGEDYIGMRATQTGTAAAPVWSAYAGQRKVNEWTAMGVKVKQEIGSSDTFVALSYSKKDDKNGNPIVLDSNKIEFDFEYGLGGGATFFAGLDRLNEDVSKYTPTNGLPIATKATKKTTTVEAGIKMKF